MASNLVRRPFHIAAALVVTLLLAASTPVRSCPIDAMCFALDQSDSMVGMNYSLVLQFVTDVVTDLSHDATKAIYSAFGYSNFATRLSEPTYFVNDFVNDVHNAGDIGGSTNMYAGVKACLDDLRQVRGNRVIVLLTDCADNGTPRAIKLAPHIRAAGVSLVSIGIGPTVRPNYMRKLSTTPDSFVSTTRQELVKMAYVMADKACAVVKEPRDTCESAYKACEFRFAGRQHVPSYKIPNRPFKVFSNAVIKANGVGLGVLNSNGVAPDIIRPDGTTMPITSKGSPKFPSAIIEAIYRPGTYNSGLAHSGFEGKQKDDFRGLCIKMVFTGFQTQGDGIPPEMTGNVNVEPEDGKCVVFRTQ